jgi:hypothetical protein
MMLMMGKGRVCQQGVRQQATLQTQEEVSHAPPSVCCPPAALTGGWGAFLQAGGSATCMNHCSTPLLPPTPLTPPAS